MSGDQTDDGSDDRTRVGGGSIVDGTVEELLAAVQGLLKDESELANSLNTRASGLTGFIGIILSIAAASGVAVGQRGSGLHDGVRIFVGVLVALALLALVIAVIAVVAKVLRPTEGFTINISEVRRYPTWDFISSERVMIQGRLMRGYVKALERDRARNQSKAKWLRRGYALVSIALALVATAGVAATLDRYVAGGSNERSEQRTPDEPGTRTVSTGDRD